MGTRQPRYIRECIGRARAQSAKLGPIHAQPRTGLASLVNHAAQPRNSGLVHLAMIYRTQSHAIYLTITLNTGSKDNTSRSQRKTRLYRSWRLGSPLEHLTTTATRESLMAVNILRLLLSSMHRPHGSSCIFPCILHASFMHLMSQHSPHPSKVSSW